MPPFATDGQTNSVQPVYLRSLVSVLCLLLFTSGCESTVQNVNQLSAGMTKPEVVALLGEPSSSSSPGNGIELLKFRLTKSRAYRLAVPLHSDYLVRFVAGKVDAYGTPRDMSASHLDPRERTVNLNIKSDQPTAPIQPVIQP